MALCRVSKPKPKVDCTFMPPPLVAVNPLSSAMSLKERQELALTTKEKERKARESQVVKSLFDFKGNSRHKEETFKPATEEFKNPFKCASEY